MACVSKALCLESVMGLAVSRLRILDCNITFLLKPALAFLSHAEDGMVTVLVPPTLLVPSTLSSLQASEGS